MPGPSETVEFAVGEPDPVLDRMARLAVDRRGWINLRPFVVDDDGGDDRGPGLMGVFAAGGPPVPLCTWSPGEPRRRGDEPRSIGIQHGTGPKVVRRLTAAALPPPPGWSVVQDHPRRGLVLRVPVDEPHVAVLGWLLEAGEALSLPPPTGWWAAAVFVPGA